MHRVRAFSVLLRSFAAAVSTAALVPSHLQHFSSIKWGIFTLLSLSEGSFFASASAGWFAFTVCPS